LTTCWPPGASSEPDQTEPGSYFVANYPPFDRWSEAAVPEVRAAFEAAPTAAEMGLYLHIPFCRKRCKFCYFRVYTDVSAADVERYSQALAAEARLAATQPAVAGRPLKYVYFGGGTPSFLSVRQLERLVAGLHESFGWDAAEEVTFECEPGTLSEPKVQALKQLGVTRLSLGVENFDDAILEANGRAHLSAEIRRSWDWIRRADFPSTNIDLIGGRDRRVVAAVGRSGPCPRARQPDDLSAGTAVQYGVRQKQPRRWDAHPGGGLANQAGLGRLGLQSFRRGWLCGVERLHAGPRS
jgi:coproporphyrinogen III oxidase-like Fe-S oxidoreductase